MPNPQSFWNVLQWKTLGQVLPALALPLVLLSSPLTANARLGQAPSVLPDAKPAEIPTEMQQQENRGVQRSVRSARADYTVSSSVLPTGTTVNEYVNASGKVFAVSWEGPVKPDLKELLGVHFQKLEEESGKAPHAGRAKAKVEHPDIVIRESGRMRAHRGQAWLPKELPESFSLEEMQ